MRHGDERRRVFQHGRRLYRRHLSQVFEVPCVLLLLLLCISGVSSQSGSRPRKGSGQQQRTLERDKEALLNIKDALFKQSNRDTSGTIFDSWKAETDPCADKWVGLFCSCEGASLLVTAGGTTFDQYCDESDESVKDLRVVGLMLPGGTGEKEKWMGPLVPEFGDMDHLQILGLEQNEFTGPIPESFSQLSRLRYLNLANNKLDGRIPRSFRGFNQLTRLELNSNNFSGPIPKIGCGRKGKDEKGERRLDTVLVRGNIGFCGEVPKCMEDLIRDVNDTSLYHSKFLPEELKNGTCDQTPPVCTASLGCQIQLPDYWTEERIVKFNFTHFTDEESGISSYDVRLIQVGTTPSTNQFNLSQAHRVNLTNLQPNGTVVFVNEDEDPPTVHDLNVYRTDLGEIGEQLINGAVYSVTVIAQNGAGPPLKKELEAGNVTVDFTPPMNTPIFNTPNGTDADEQNDGDDLGFSLNSTLTDQETGIASVLLRVYEVVDPENLTKSIRVHQEGNISVNVTSWILDKNAVALVEGRMYQYDLHVTNGAGLTERLLSDPFTLIVSTSLFLRNVLYGVVAACVFVIGAVSAAALVYYIPKIRQIARFDPDEYLKSFMYQVLEGSPEETRTLSMPIMDQQELAFVITDEESSTEQSICSESGFKQLRNIHDMIIRDTYEQYSGYEIHTEGDSFQLAFSSVSGAIRFCIDVQHKFLEFKWGSEVLRLPGCNVVKDGRGKDIVFRGPRVRMAIHWAQKDLVVNRVHAVTKHRIFEGPAFQIAKELSNAASGGQVLMSHEAWLHFRNDFSKAGFPTIELLGSYMMDTWPEAMPIYNVTQRVGKKLIRSFPNLRRLQCINHYGAGLNIIAPPAPNHKGLLTFVALKVEPQTDDPESPLLAITFDLFAQHAQYFTGHLFHIHSHEGVALVAFGTPQDAVRFSHVIQMALVLHSWPVEVMSLCGPTVPGPSYSQVPLFHGPRVSIAIHSTQSFGISLLQGMSDHGSRHTDYAGHGVSFVQRLVRVAHGGQIILSGRTWTTVQNSLPKGSQTISLGKHVLGEDYLQPVWLFELLPQDFKQRSFPAVKTKEKLEPGYSDAPSIDNDIAIVFAKVDKPEIIRRFEERKDVADVTEEEMRETLAAYYQSIAMFCTVVRKRLGTYRGYECKEPESGKFTLAFPQMTGAIFWACHVHAELLSLEWPKRLLILEECTAEVRCGRVIHRGLRVKIGMAYGRVYEKSPINTGRADYFGALPNLAARVSTLARPGQFLIHSSRPFDRRDVVWMTNDAGLMLYEDPLEPEADGASEVAVEISKLGMFLLRGFNELKQLYQAQPASVAMPGRFGTNDVASMYGGEGHRPVQTTVTKLWNHIRFKNPLKTLPSGGGSFLSHTVQQNGLQALASSSYSHSAQSRPVSPPLCLHGLPPGEAAALGSGKNGRTALLETIHTQTDEGHGDDRTGSEAELLPNFSPRSPIYFSSRTFPPSSQNAHGSSSSLPYQPTPDNEDPHFELQPLESVKKNDSVNSDECIISFGTTESVHRVIPPAPTQGSSDEGTSPVEYGYQVASLYSNVTGGRSSLPEFSFFSQKSDSPDAT